MKAKSELHQLERMDQEFMTAVLSEFGPFLEYKKKNLKTN